MLKTKTTVRDGHETQRMLFDIEGPIDLPHRRQELEIRLDALRATAREIASQISSTEHEISRCDQQSS